ncbi:MAG: hypothetical protein ABI134_16290, partial [Byssovorax sp.]
MSSASRALPTVSADRALSMSFVERRLESTFGEGAAGAPLSRAPTGAGGGSCRAVAPAALV